MSATHRLTASDCKENEMMAQSIQELEALGPSGDPVQRLRLLCLSRGVSGILDLGRVFRRMDQDGNKQLTQDEFIRGLRESGLKLANDEGEALFRGFDNDQKGRIFMNEFLACVRPPLADCRVKVIEKAFHKMAKSENGLLDLNDLKRGYNVAVHPKYNSGEESRDTIFHRVLGSFAKNPIKEGMVTFEEFLNYYSAISTSIDNDLYFDLMMRQCYKL